MRALRLIVPLALALGGCGQPAPDCPVCPAPQPTAPGLTTARPIPSLAGYRMVLAVDDATWPSTFWGLYYGAVSHGWRVTVAGPPSGIFPTALTVDAVKPAEFDVLVIAGDVDVSKIVPYFGFVAAVGQGARFMSAAGTGLSPDGSPTQFTRLTVGAPGEVPLLLHQLNTYAADRLRVRHRATGGHPP